MPSRWLLPLSIDESPPSHYDDGYDCFRLLIQQLRAEGFMEAYQRLDDIFCHTACTTGNELIGELGLAIREFLRTRPRISPSLGKTLKICKKIIRRECGPFFFW
jgi:hypothetical protein